MIDRREWAAGLRRLGIPPGAPVIAHASLSAFGPTAGGASTVVEALLDVFSAVIMPVFTYVTMVTPEIGPACNGLEYGAEDGNNRRAQFFYPGMPADRLMGVIPEQLRRSAKAQRSAHPILSFAGVNADAALRSQTLQFPLAPIQALLHGGGWALLLGVDHTANTSIHLGERLAGREPFLRWALTPDGVMACPGFPGCSDGFQALEPALAGAAHTARIGVGLAQAFRLADLIDGVQVYLKKDPLGLLCEHSYCPRCFDARRRIVN